MINCIVVDDESHAIELLTIHIGQTPFLKLVGTASNPAEALVLLNTKSVELIFLDIQMTGMSGIEFLPLLNGKYKVILTTAFREYALDGFDHQVLDYLLKPILFPRFLQAVQLAQTAPTPAQKEPDNFIMVKTELKGKLVKINIEDIIYIEGKGRFISFHTRNGEEVVVLLNIGNIEERLPVDRFFRVHKSFIIALSSITMIQGNMLYLESTKHPIPLGQSHRSVFMQHMHDKVITNKSKDDSDFLS